MDGYTALIDYARARPHSTRKRQPSVILVTGATGLVGTALVPRLVAAGTATRCLVRDPRQLGDQRVQVQIAVGDLTQPRSFENPMRGVDTVIHLAGSLRDQENGSIEELNGLATLRMVQAAESAGVKRFIFLTALGANELSASRFMRAKAFAERCVERAALEGIVLACSLIYAPGDPFLSLLRRLGRLPVVPVPGSGKARFQPIWAGDVAQAVARATAPTVGGKRYEIAGPEEMTLKQLMRAVQRAAGRRRPVLPVPLSLVQPYMKILDRARGEKAFVTWDEVEVLGITSVGNPGYIRRLGVEPKPMAEVLGIRG